MPSQTYLLFRAAILARKQVTCLYRGKHRELCPHVLGIKSGQERALAYQFAGESNSSLPPGGEWRCLRLHEVRNARVRDGDWHTGVRHTTTQACVDLVDRCQSLIHPCGLRRMRTPDHSLPSPKQVHPRGADPLWPSPDAYQCAADRPDAPAPANPSA